MPKNAAIATTFFAATTPETFSGDGVRTELLGFSTPIRPDHYGAIALDGSDCLVVGHDQQAEPASGAAPGGVGLLILSWVFRRAYCDFSAVCGVRLSSRRIAGEERLKRLGYDGPERALN